MSRARKGVGVDVTSKEGGRGGCHQQRRGWGGCHEQGKG